MRTIICSLLILSGCAAAVPIAVGVAADLLICESIRQYHRKQGCPEGCYEAGEQCVDTFVPFKSPEM